MMPRLFVHGKVGGGYVNSAGEGKRAQKVVFACELYRVFVLLLTGEWEQEISASRMEGGKEDGDGDADGEGEDKTPGGKSKAEVKDGGAGGKKDKAGKQQGAKDPGPTVTERLSLPDAGVSILKKGRMHSIEKETRAKLSLEGSVVVIEGGGSCVNKAKRDVERMLRSAPFRVLAPPLSMFAVRTCAIWLLYVSGALSSFQVC
jgi:hypothetical protein